MTNKYEKLDDFIKKSAVEFLFTQTIHNKEDGGFQIIVDSQINKKGLMNLDIYVVEEFEYCTFNEIQNKLSNLYYLLKKTSMYIVDRYAFGS
jgi:hypothetical protein